MQKEAKLIRQLNNPHVIRLISSKVEGTRVILRLEKAAFGSVRSILNAQYPNGFEDQLVLQYTQHVLKALKYLHSKVCGHFYILSHISYATLLLPVHYSSQHQDGTLSPDRGREHRRFGLPKCHPSGKHPGHNESHTQPLRLPEARRLGAGLHQLAEPRISVASMTQSA